MAQKSNPGGSAAAKEPEDGGVPVALARPIGRLTIRVINDMGAATIFFTKACAQLFARDQLRRILEQLSHIGARPWPSYR